MFTLALPHIDLAFHRILVLLCQLGFCLPSASSAELKSQLAHDHRTNSDCRKSNFLGILLDSKPKYCFQIIQIIFPFFVPTTTKVFWEAELRPATSVLRPQPRMLNKTCHFSLCTSLSSVSCYKFAYRACGPINLQRHVCGKPSSQDLTATIQIVPGLVSRQGLVIKVKGYYKAGFHK